MVRAYCSCYTFLKFEITQLSWPGWDSNSQLLTTNLWANNKPSCQGKRQEDSCLHMLLTWMIKWFVSIAQALTLTGIHGSNPSWDMP